MHSRPFCAIYKYMKRILIVDDSKNWLDYHSYAIKELFPDYIIETADSAHAGIAKITANIDNPYDIVITDLQMEIDFLPLYAGEWFVRELQMYKEYKNTRIIIVSATSSIKNVAQKYNVEYIPKYMCKTIDAYKTLS